MIEEQQDIRNNIKTTQQETMRLKQQPFISYGGQLAILIGLVGFGIILAALATILLWMGLTHTSINSMETNMTNPTFSKVLEIIQIVSSALMFFFPVIMLAVIVSRKPFKYLHFNTHFSTKQIFLVILIVLTGLFVSNSLGIINEIIPIPKSWQTYFHQKEDQYNNAVQAIATMKTFADYLISLLVIAIAPAIIEESFFRGGLQQLFVKWFKKVGIGIVVTSIIFSAIHLSYYGFLARAALGVVLGLIFYYGKNIWLNIFAHFLNNGIAITQLYILTKSGKNIKQIMNDDSLPFVSGHASAVAAIVMLVIGVYILRILFNAFKKECVKAGVNEEADVYIKTNTNPFEE